MLSSAKLLRISIDLAGTVDLLRHDVNVTVDVVTVNAQSVTSFAPLMVAVGDTLHSSTDFDLRHLDILDCLSNLNSVRRYVDLMHGWSEVIDDKGPGVLGSDSALNKSLICHFEDQKCSTACSVSLAGFATMSNSTQ
jgi:hypothetical protein